MAHTGGMIALVPSKADAAKLAVPGGDPADEMHVTLAYLGDDVTTLPAHHRAALIAGCKALAASQLGHPLQGDAFGHAVFNPAGDEPASVYTVNGPLTGVHNRAHRLARNTLGGDYPTQHQPWIPHITAGYNLPAGKLHHTGPVQFDRLRLALGGKVHDFPLHKPSSAPVTLAVLTPSNPKTCKFCAKPATKGVMWWEGKARLPVCDGHVDAGKAKLRSQGVDPEKVVDLSAETPGLAAVHRPLGTHGLWGDKHAQLPAYIQNIAHSLETKRGLPESQAIQLAIGAVQRWARGEGNVTPEVRAAATAALAEWERLKATHNKTTKLATPLARGGLVSPGLAFEPRSCLHDDVAKVIPLANRAPKGTALGGRFLPGGLSLGEDELAAMDGGNLGRLSLLVSKLPGAVPAVARAREQVAAEIDRRASAPTDAVPTVTAQVDSPVVLARQEDDLQVIELAAVNHRHVPGTPFEWRHGYVPLSPEVAAKWRKTFKAAAGAKGAVPSARRKPKPTVDKVHRSPAKPATPPASKPAPDKPKAKAGKSSLLHDDKGRSITLTDAHKRAVKAAKLSTNEQMQYLQHRFAGQTHGDALAGARSPTRVPPRYLASLYGDRERLVDQADNMDAFASRDANQRHKALLEQVDAIDKELTRSGAPAFNVTGSDADTAANRARVASAFVDARLGTEKVKPPRISIETPQGQFNTTTADHVVAWHDADEIGIGPRTLTPAAEKNYQAALRVGFYTDTGEASLVEHAVNHEYGHHLAEHLSDEGIGNLIDRLAVEIPGASPPRPGESPVAWADRNKAAIVSGVGTYAGENIDELLAELWAEGRLSPNPSPAATSVVNALMGVAA